VAGRKQMGDRCYINLTLLKKDRIFFAEIFGGTEEEWYDQVDWEDDRYISVIDHQANHAWYDELNEAAARGLVFFGNHASGGNYGAGAFIGIDGGCDYVDIDSDGHPTVRVSEDGEINGNQYFGAMDYYKNIRRAKEIIYGKQE